MVYSTYIGGSGDDSAAKIAVDINGLAYIAGYTTSTNFPIVSAAQTSNHGGKDAFILKLNAAGSALTYSTYLGGTLDDQANGVAVDTNGNIYVAGASASSTFPVTAAYQGTYGGGASDAFVAKLTPAGVITYATFLGGSGTDSANAITVDSAGDAVVTGATNSYNGQLHPGVSFPVKNAVQTQYSDTNNELATQVYPGGPPSDAFLAKLNPAGSDLIFSTYYGGSTTGMYSA